MGIPLSRAELTKGFEPVKQFDTDRVREIFQEFEEVCPTPVLWEIAFGELLDCFESDEERLRTFSDFDTDKDGLVDGRELIGTLAVVCQGHLNDRMSLLFDVYDMNQEGSMVFDEVNLMLRRVIGGLRKITGLTVPPEKVIYSMTKRIWKTAGKHTDMRISGDDWNKWWSTDSTMRHALKMFTHAPEDVRGLPTPDQLIFKDYAKEVSRAEAEAAQKAEREATVRAHSQAAELNAGRSPLQRAGQLVGAVHKWQKPTTPGRGDASAGSYPMAPLVPTPPASGGPGPRRSSRGAAAVAS